ncbi:MAG TPA: hypothetical protein VG318_10275 [Actinomycetota bacterium]|nr:hypothetical protein [Actinomycetota bacterium]
MTTEDSIREALRRHADTHRVNPVLDRSTLLKARLSRVGTVVVAAAAVTSLVFGGAAVVGAVGDGERGLTPAAPAASTPPPDAGPLPEGVPFLLVTADGWRMTRVDQYEPHSGEMTFTDGTRQIELFWRPEDTHEFYVGDREAGAGDSWDITVAGSEGILFQYEGTTDFTAMWLHEGRSLELRGVFPTVDDFRAIAATVRPVDGDTWVAALPEDAVAPGERPETVDEMLAGLPVHPDVDVEALKGARTVNDRYQVGAEVVSALACEWIEQWVDARESGDGPRAREAESAMATSREWAILVEMDEGGDFSEVVWEYADAMATDGEVPGGRPLTAAGSYRNALGCK